MRRFKSGYSAILLVLLIGGGSAGLVCGDGGVDRDSPGGRGAEATPQEGSPEEQDDIFVLERLVIGLLGDKSSGEPGEAPVAVVPADHGGILLVPSAPWADLEGERGEAEAGSHVRLVWEHGVTLLSLRKEVSQSTEPWTQARRDSLQNRFRYVLARDRSPIMTPLKALATSRIEDRPPTQRFAANPPRPHGCLAKPHPCILAGDDPQSTQVRKGGREGTRPQKAQHLIPD